MKYHIITYGCQFNKSDTERVKKVLTDLGYKSTDKLNDADIVLVLACSVRQSAIDRIYGLKKKFEEIKKNRPLITVLSGCVLKSDLPKMRKIFDIIFEITDLAKLPKKLQATSYQLKTESYFNIHPSYKSDFQAYIPIMTGCNNFCAYCVVPYVRGKEGARPAAEILEECQELIKKGYKEITLLGQNVNSYTNPSRIKHELHTNKYSNIKNFAQLLKAVDEIPGDYWLRFVTSHPKDLSDELIEVMSKGKHITPYLHLPVQSGDDEILKKMNRHYTVAHYKDIIRKIRLKIRNISISTDVIVGFPGETKEQFENTVKLFKEIKFDMAYIAQYSERAGTAAAKLKDDVEKTEKKRREKVLTEILKKTALENNKKLIGETVEVLIEECKNGYCLGKTSTFKTTKFKSTKDYTGQFVKVKISGCDAWGLRGEIQHE